MPDRAETGPDHPEDPSNAPRAAVEAYRPAPTARSSESYRVRALGRSVFVERFADISYARFAMRGSVLVEVEVPRPIERYRVFPPERAASITVRGTVLTLELRSADSVVVSVDALETLFLLPDALATERPDGGDPGVFDVTDHGADPTGRSIATTAIQAAIDAAWTAGGGTVLLPPGVYRAGTLTLRSHVTLHVAEGALLHGSADPADYPIDPGRQESAADPSLPPDVRYLGRTMTFSRLLLVDGAKDVRITGRGTIDGEGTSLRTQRDAAPNLLRVRESSNVSITDLLVRNAAAWSIHLLASNHIDIRNVKVINDRNVLNTDGIDPDMSQDVVIDRCFIYTKDDAICVKATRNSDLAGDPARILVTNNLVSAVDAALKVGTESWASTFTDIRFEDNDVFDSGRAMSVVVRDGAVYDRLRFRRIRVGPGVDHLIEQVIGLREPDAAWGAIHDLAFDGVVAPDYRRPEGNSTWYTQFRPSGPDRTKPVPVFEGVDPTHAVDGLRLRAVVVNGEHLVDAATAERVANLTIGPHVRNVSFE